MGLGCASSAAPSGVSVWGCVFRCLARFAGWDAGSMLSIGPSLSCWLGVAAAAVRLRGRRVGVALGAVPAIGCGTAGEPSGVGCSSAATACVDGVDSACPDGRMAVDGCGVAGMFELADRFFSPWGGAAPVCVDVEGVAGIAGCCAWVEVGRLWYLSSDCETAGVTAWGRSLGVAPACGFGCMEAVERSVGWLLVLRGGGALGA